MESHLTLEAVKAEFQLWRQNKYKVSELVIPKVKIDNKRLRYLTLDEERRLLEA